MAKKPELFADDIGFNWFRPDPFSDRKIAVSSVKEEIMELSTRLNMLEDYLGVTMVKQPPSKYVKKEKV